MKDVIDDICDRIVGREADLCGRGGKVSFQWDCLGYFPEGRGQ